MTSFSIITPSFRSMPWLPLCVASVADQKGVSVEHLIQDAGSDDGTVEWLEKHPQVKAIVEKDDGMYDAINRGLRRSSGEILAYLNSDEQYLPGALEQVARFFEAHPEVEVALAHSIVVSPEGEYICHRHSLLPSSRSIWLRFSVLTSSIFFRASVFRQRGLQFDTQYRALGDFHWFRALLAARVNIQVLDVITSTFVDSGDNLCLKPIGRKEMADSVRMRPRLVKWFAPFYIARHRLKRLLAGHFTIPPGAYSIYTVKCPEQRVEFQVPKPTGVWAGRL
jgi:glycosyltransferase involved in cell wall biosynthesis